MEQDEFKTMLETGELATYLGDEPGIDDEDLRVQCWRAEQLHRLGLSWFAALTWEPFVDWHELARLVDRGCPPELALEIVR